MEEIFIKAEPLIKKTAAWSATRGAAQCYRASVFTEPANCFAISDECEITNLIGTTQKRLSRRWT